MKSLFDEKTQYEIDNWSGRLPKFRLSPVKWRFRLNGAYMSYLDCRSLGMVSAFSGQGDGRNNPFSIAKEKEGPIPMGTYYIIDRESGGRLAWWRDQGASAFTGVDRTKWFALWNGVSGDIANVNGIVRRNFRLHPAGYWGVSEGCITISNGYDFDQIEGYLRSSPPELVVPVGALKAYGTVEVTQ